MIKHFISAIAVLAMVLALAVVPATAHNSSKSAGGSCPHTSSSLHTSVGYTASLAAGFSSSDQTCIQSRIRVRAKIGGSWTTNYHYGDPGVLANNYISSDVAWTKHDVKISSGGSTYWGGLTIWH